MTVTLLDYGMGNLRSVTRALEAAGAKVGRSERPGDGPVVLPGVGAFPEASRRLRASGAWDEILECARRQRPLLGICLGMQLLFEESEEHALTPGLALFGGRVEAIGRAVTVPNMGWHRLHGLGEPFVYFAHSFGVRETTETVATIEHGGAWTAAIHRGCVTGYQFHPEKSGADGISLLRGWVQSW